MKKVIRLITLVLFLVYTSCTILKPKETDKESTQYWEYVYRKYRGSDFYWYDLKGLMADEACALVISGVSQKDYKYIKSIDFTDEHIVFLLRQILENSSYYNFRTSTYLYAQADFDRKIKAVLSFHDFYDNENKTLYLIIKFGHDKGVPNSSYYQHIYNGFTKNITPRFSAEGYYIRYSYEGKNRKISGSSDGMISINIVMDILTPVIVGGHRSQTDKDGEFHFSGRPSLARISEGVIQLISDDGIIVEARKNEAGKWSVTIEGEKGGEAITTVMEIDSLN